MKIPFLGGWTSINPSYFDVNYRGTRFWHTAIWDMHLGVWEDQRSASIIYRETDAPQKRFFLVCFPMFSDVFPCFHDLQADLFSRLRNAGFFRPEFLNRLDEIIAPGRKQRWWGVITGSNNAINKPWSIVLSMVLSCAIYRISILPHGIIYGYIIYNDIYIYMVL